MSSYFSRFAPDSGSSGTRQPTVLNASFPSQRSESQLMATSGDSQSASGSQIQGRFEAMLNDNRLLELKRCIDKLVKGQDDVNNSIDALKAALLQTADQVGVLDRKLSSISEEIKCIRREAKRPRCEERVVAILDSAKEGGDSGSELQDSLDEEDEVSQDVQDYLIKKCRKNFN